MVERSLRTEWPTLVVLAGTYTLWALATTLVTPLWLAIGLAGVAAAMQSSLTHEMLHGHPTRSPLINGALVFPALSLAIPYMRFRDTHLAHHDDERLTDPYDDPETNYMDPAVWVTLPQPVRLLMRVNNTLAGRMVLGPVIGQILFMCCDLRATLGGDRRVLAGWLLHIPAVLMVVWWAVAVGQMPWWAYLLQAWLALGLLKIRTFLEHRAHEDTPCRTVVIESRGPLAFLFLNNNFHIVHHSHPGVQWWRMPQLYFADRAGYLQANGGYVFSSYGEVFRRYFLRAKDPVPHPLWQSDR